MPSINPGAAELLRLLRTRGELSRAEIAGATGWARVTVTARLDELVDTGLVRATSGRSGARGRPAATYAFDPGRADLLVADVGAAGARVALCDLAGQVLTHRDLQLQIGDGPDVVLETVANALRALTTGHHDLPWGVGVGLPGPVEHPRGRVVSPPIMTGWDGVVVPDRLGPLFGAPVLVENDANAMAWGEHRAGPAPVPDMIFVKVGTGIGMGIIAQGQVLRGASGAAGDLGHTWADAPEAQDRLCRCGKTGCVEAFAGGWAIAGDLGGAGGGVIEVDDVIELLRAGDAQAVNRVRRAGRVLGAGIAQAVSLLNPSEVVIGGRLAEAGEHLLAGVREHVAARSLPLATADLRIRTSSDPGQAGVAGLGDALSELVLSGGSAPTGQPRTHAARERARPYKSLDNAVALP